MRVVLQGEVGSFHHLAALHWFGPEAEYIPADSFRTVFQLLADGHADQAVVAIENSLFGSINEVYDLLHHYQFPIIGELSERIHQQLITNPNLKLTDITAVVSHPVALAQCSDYLDAQLPAAERIEYHDTAAAVQYIQQPGHGQFAAIASQVAADQAGLPILAKNIENDNQNFTRFLVIAPGATPPDGANKASLVMQTSHRAGALHAALGIFADAGINLTKLQSRPIIGQVWQYQFYIDVEATGQPLQAVIIALEAQDCKVEVLGQYPASSDEYED
jgi:prephenate dehydratase